LCLAKNLKQVCTINTPLNSSPQWSIPTARWYGHRIVDLQATNVFWVAFWIPEVWQICRA
jgi:hypothetical protein